MKNFEKNSNYFITVYTTEEYVNVMKHIEKKLPKALWICGGKPTEFLDMFKSFEFNDGITIFVENNKISYARVELASEFLARK